MCVNLLPGNLNPGVYPPHPISIYTCEMTTAPKVSLQKTGLIVAFSINAAIAISIAAFGDSYSGIFKNGSIAAFLRVYSSVCQTPL